ncbi:MAG TPA: response regulator transcription factor [Acidimicrobiales bacterium]|jgi:two-component system, chemotaxis family, chemotaxis protein CheY|nr:response regulator transcription factor [Acidimicrobiales bacterium]
MKNGVLVVDDEADMRVLVRGIIDRANEGLQVVSEASSGKEALDRWRETKPNVILLDHRMPDMTGLETAELVLAEQPDQHIVMFSAYLDEATVERAFALGVRACLDKRDLARIPETLWGLGAA